MARSLLVGFLAVALVAGGTVPSTAADPVRTVVTLDGGKGEWVSAGRDYRYTRDSARIQATYGDGHLRITVVDGNQWDGRFFAPQGQRRLTVGRYHFGDTLGADYWSGHARTCTSPRGWFEITKIRYAHRELVELVMRFTQRCDTGAPAMTGMISWAAATSGPRPQNPRPEPEGTWRPPAGAIPATGNVIYLESASGDYVGTGRTELLRPAPEHMYMAEDWAGHIRFYYSPPWASFWGGEFSAPAISDRLQRGFYGSLRRYPFDNPVEGGLSWSSEGRGCNRVWGWFAIDRLKKVAGETRGVTLRFTQRCESSSAPPLRGYVRWDASTPAPSPGFSDIIGHRYELPMNRMGAQGWMRGDGEGRFRPNGRVTRGQIATIMARALDLDPPSANAPNFTDIAKSPHRDAIRSIAEYCGVKGYRDGTFRPNVAMSRGMFAKIAHQTLFGYGYFRRPHGGFFFDTLGKASEHGTRMMIGRAYRPVGSGRYRPEPYVTRAFVAMVLAREKELVPTLQPR